MGGLLVGKRIGKYHIKRIISSGGMGMVYEAVQEQPRRTVAVKVMKESITSRSLLRRFEYESQILARLRHPGIAQVFEAGTHTEPDGDRTGVPFFVMEYIPNARPITRHVTDKRFSTKERLELFIQACEAVHHGHQKGIIHRDLKPANILVDSSGQVKIIDFGVARATDSDMTLTTIQTEVGLLIGTVQYMSPEQCEADPHDLDVRSDVYALGVVLYELLCGELPYELQKVSVFEALRRIREAPVKKPSASLRALRGDVETIVLKALEKDRNRRYQSADGLARDIRYYLKGEPIEAKRDSFSYMLRKQLSRHKISVAVVLGFILVIFAGFAASLILWRRSVAEATNAKFRLEAARAETTRSFEEYQALIPRFRRAEELAGLLPEKIQRQYPLVSPNTTYLEANNWILEQFSSESKSTSGTFIEGLTSELQNEVFTWIGNPFDPWNREAVNWIRENRSSLKGIIQATSRFRFYYGPTTIKGPFYQQRLPSLLNAKLALRLLAANALVLQDEQHEEAAMESLRGAVRLARYLGDGATMINTLTENECRDAIYTTYRWMVVDAARKGTVPAAYLTFFREDPPLPSFEHGYITEVRSLRQIINEAFTITDSGAPPRLDVSFLRDTLIGYGAEENPYENPSERLIEDIDTLEYEHAISIVTELCKRLFVQRDATFREIEAEGDRIESHVLEHHPALRPLLPNLTRALILLRQCRMNHDATIIATAIHTYQDRRGFWPESVDTAMAAFDSAPKHRSYFGHDFAYRIENGAPLLYTVGPNGKDDGGRGKRYAYGFYDKDRSAGDDVIFLTPHGPAGVVSAKDR